MPPLLALLVKDNRPVAVIAPDTVIVWSLLTVKVLPLLAVEPIVKAAPAPELLTVTLPVVLAVMLVVLVESVPIEPEADVSVTVPDVIAPAAEMLPEPSADSEAVPAEGEPVERLELTAMPAPLVVVCRLILPPAVVVPKAMAPPTVSAPAANISTVGPLVEVIAPVLTVEEDCTVKLVLPRVIVLPLLLKVPPVKSERLPTLDGAAKLAPVVKAAVLLVEPTDKMVAVILPRELLERLKLLEPARLTVSVLLCGMTSTDGALTLPVTDTL